MLQNARKKEKKKSTPTNNNHQRQKRSLTSHISSQRQPSHWGQLDQGIVGDSGGDDKIGRGEEKKKHPKTTTQKEQRGQPKKKKKGACHSPCHSGVLIAPHLTPLQCKRLLPTAVHTLICNVWFPLLPAPPLPHSANPYQEALGVLCAAYKNAKGGSERGEEGEFETLPRWVAPFWQAARNGPGGPRNGCERGLAGRGQKGKGHAAAAGNTQGPLKANVGISQV